VAEAVRQAYYGYYGSSIGGVLRHCQVDASELIDFVHDLPLEDHLSPDPQLANTLSSLPGRKFVFTNAPAEYTWRALHALAVDRCFDGVFDIYFGGLEGKPSPAVYEKVLATLGWPTGMCWLVDDSLVNLLPAKALGCRTVWITPDGKAPPIYVDQTIRHLAELLDILK
jgi:putative hydrolase of the HAD superfamily